MAVDNELDRSPERVPHLVSCGAIRRLIEGLERTWKVSGRSARTACHPAVHAAIAEGAAVQINPGEVVVDGEPAIITTSIR
jgi:hypothetical protein